MRGLNYRSSKNPKSPESKFFFCRFGVVLAPATATLNALACARARKQIDWTDEQRGAKNAQRAAALTSSSFRLSRSSELSEPAASIMFRLCRPCLPSPVVDTKICFFESKIHKKRQGGVNKACRAACRGAMVTHRASCDNRRRLPRPARPARRRLPG